MLATDSHVVYHARDVAKGLSDPNQWDQAIMRGAVFVTQNSGDFKLLHEAWLVWAHWGLAKVHPGAIVLRPGRRASDSLEDIRLILRTFTVFANRLVLFDRATQRWSYWPAET
jgi:hypothetical protein